jgi:hypothetical protein
MTVTFPSNQLKQVSFSKLGLDRPRRRAKVTRNAVTLLLIVATMLSLAVQGLAQDFDAALLQTTPPLVVEVEKDGLPDLVAELVGQRLWNEALKEIGRQIPKADKQLQARLKRAEGQLYEVLHMREDSEVSYQRALQILRRLPQSQSTAIETARVYLGLGRIFDQRSDGKKAVDWYGRAVLQLGGHLEDVAGVDPALGRLKQLSSLADVRTSADGPPLSHCLDDIFFEFGIGASSDYPYVLRMLVYGTSRPERIFSGYSEFEGYRAYGFFPTGMSLRYFGFRLRRDQPSSSVGFYLAAGPFLAGGSDKGKEESNMTEEKSDIRGAAGIEVNSKFFLRVWYLPPIVGGLRASAGTENFLEWSAELQSGPWGRTLAKVFGFGLRFERRLGSLWSEQVFDESSLLLTLRISP